MIQGNKLERIMERIQLLIARADHPNTPPAEAEVARHQADTLMFKYKIETLSQPESVGLEPIWGKVILCDVYNEFSNFYYSLGIAIVQHTGCLYHQSSETNPEDGFRYYTLEFVGFEGDVRYAEMLLTSALLAFSKALEPKFNKEESLEANAFRLRQGGMERARIANLMFGPSETVNEQKGKNRRVTTLIKQHANRIGRPELAEELLGRKTNIKTYRRSFANGFYSTLIQRIRQLGADRAASGEGELVLHSMKERIEEALYTKFPHLRPRPQEARIGDGYSQRSSQRDCDRCAKTKSGYCREHSWMKPRRGRTTYQSFSQAAASSGARAARSVDLGAGTRRKIGN